MPLDRKNFDRSRPAVAILLYDVISKQTFHGVKDWTADIADKTAQNIRLIPSGNESDLADERLVPDRRRK
jgi:hypothetical protein